MLLKNLLLPQNHRSPVLITKQLIYLFRPGWAVQNRIDKIQHLPISETTKTASFEVPDGYFDTLPSKIQEYGQSMSGNRKETNHR